MSASLERYIRNELSAHGSVKVGKVVDVCEVSRQYVYRVVNRHPEWMITQGVIIKVHQGNFLQALIGWGVTIEPELLSKAIEFAEREDFDLRTVYEKPFIVDEDGVGLLRVIQALLIAVSRDLPFKMTLELD